MPLDDLAAYEAASPTLLAMQPLKLPDKSEVAGNDWPEIYTHLEARMSAMRTDRWSWWAYWNSIAEFILPRRHRWFVTSSKTQRGNPINQSIIDSTATMAMQICASGLWTGLTSPSRPWFKLGIGLPWIELDADGKDWLEDTQQRVYTVLAQSNFYTTMAQGFQDVATFGSSPVIIYEDYEDVIRCYLPTAGEYFLGVGSRLSVDTLYREFTQTTLQIVEMFTLRNCPDEVRAAFLSGGSSLERQWVVCHAIEPNFAIPSKNGDTKIDVLPGSFPYREFYWLKGIQGNGELSRRGFNARPFMAARWATTSNDAYGRSPGMDVLGDVKQLQLETRRKAEFIEKLVRPPMGADPALKNEPSSILPGNITYTSTDGSKKGFWPLFEVAPQALTPMVEDIKEIQERIKKGFFVDIFMAISQMEGVQPRNELELTKRDLERLQVLGPFVELFETEFAGPSIQRVLDILQRRKMLKPLPPSLRNIPLKIEYISIMKIAQTSAESVSMKDFFGTMGALSSAAKAAGLPDPLRVVNLDKSARHYGDLVNFPNECLFTEQEVTNHDQIRSQVKQQQQIPGQALAAVTAAKTLSQTAMPGGGSALGAMGPGECLMADLTESEIFSCMEENFRLAAADCEALAASPKHGVIYERLRRELKLCEGSCRQASAWREDTRWLQIGLQMEEAHKRAGNWLRRHAPRPLFLKLAENLREGERQAKRLKNMATGHVGMILPKAQASHELRQGRPVQVSKGGIILPTSYNGHA